MPLYFAYGSNLATEDVARWCAARNRERPSWRWVGPAELPDHTLTYHYHSAARDGGALDVIPHRGASVPGGLFEVPDFDLLDAKEGAPSRYERFECVALQDGAWCHATTYRVTSAHRQARFVAPSRAYVETVRAGCRAWGIDDSVAEAAALGVAARSRPGALFVYGTLKAGFCRAPILEAYQPLQIEPASVQGRLVDLGAYPGLVQGGSSAVVGELWSFAELDALLQEVDEVEDFLGWEDLEGSMYVRTIATASLGGSSRPAWTYVYRGADGTAIDDGIWR